MINYKNCNICPRKCSVDRTKGEQGFCGQGDSMVVSTAALHFGEEPPVTGNGGSGAIFFSGCTMKCSFCQNWQISRGLVGEVVSVETLVQIMLELQNRGAENINFVTGTHFLPSIRDSVLMAKKKGLSIPLVWNCSGYETIDAVEELNSFIDIYLPDYKSSKSELTERFFHAADYPVVVETAILKMVQSKKLLFNENGLITQGVIVRHLALPGELESSRIFFGWYSKNLIGKALISVMVQYTPVIIPGSKEEIPQGYISQFEYEKLLDFMESYNIDEGFFQDLETSGDWLPDFNKAKPFPSEQTRIVWSSIYGDFIE